LPFAVGTIPFSTRALGAGIHQLQIEALDTNNNSSIAHLNFIVNDPPSMRVESVVQDQQDLVVNASISDPNWQGTAPQSLAGEVEYSVDDGKTFSTFPVTTLQTQTDGKESRFQYRIPFADLQSSTAERLLLKARAFDGIEYSPYSLLAFRLNPLTAIDVTTLPAEGKLRATTYSNAVKIVYDTKSLVAGSISVNVGTPAAVIPLQSPDLTSHQAILPAPRMSGPWNLAVDGSSLSIPVNYVTTGSSARVTGENFELLLEPDTLLWDTFIWSKSLPPYKARYLPQIGPMLQIGPRGLPFKKNATLVFRYPPNFANPEKLSIYGWSRTGQRWTSKPSLVDPSTLSVSTKISFLDLYALIYDNVPPVVSPIFPKRTSVTRNPAPKLAVQIRDSGMDVDDERVWFYIDGKEYVPDYDPDRNLATFQVETPLRKGYHQFWVISYDYGNNKTVSPKIRFRVR
jgi:hypothetical protein